MADSSWVALNVRNSDLIRKTLGGGVAFIAPYAAAAVTNLTAGALGTIQSLPVEYKPLGWMTKDGATFPREIETSDVNSWGAKEPTRSDSTKDQSSCKIVCQETRIETLSLYLGTALTALTADVTTGEVSIAKPEAPPKLYWRLLVIGRDINAAGEVYLGRFFPKAEVAERGELAMSDGDDPVQYELTFKAYYDTVLGTSERFLWAGPGWKSLKTAMGF